MPFLDGKPWKPKIDNSLNTLAGADKLYRVSQTGEVFLSYDEYLSHLRLLQSNRWTSLKGTQGLNFSQASLEDSQHPQTALQISQNLQAPDSTVELIVRKAHHSLLPLEILVQEVQCVQGSPNADKENIHSEAQTASKPQSVSAECIRGILHKTMNVEQHGKKHIWIARPEYQKSFDLPPSIPPSIASELAVAKQTAMPNGIANGVPNGVASKPLNKRKIEAEDDSLGRSTLKKAKLSEHKMNGPLQTSEGPDQPPLRTIEEEEARLTEGTHKAVVFKALKLAGSRGYTLAQISDKIEELGIGDYNDKHKIITSLMYGDSAFVRVKKGVYAVRAMMGNESYEYVGGAKPKKKTIAATSPGKSKDQGKSPKSKAIDKEQHMNGHGAGSSQHEKPAPPRTIEEEEERLTEGTHKFAVFKALKHAGSEGYTLSQISDKIKELGIGDYHDKHKVIANLLCSNNSFVRVKKGTYAIRALMGDKAYESVGGSVPRKTKKETLRDSLAQKEKSKPTESLAKSRKGQQDSAVKQHESQSVEPPPLKTLEEEEGLLKPGTNKEYIFKALKTAGSEGLTLQQIIDTVNEQGLKEFKDTQKDMIATVLISHPAFVRVTKGVYALRALMGDKPYESIGTQQPKKKKQSLQLGNDGVANDDHKPLNGPNLQAHEAEHDIESRTKNEVIELEVRNALEAHSKALQKALANEEKAQARLNAASKDGLAGQSLPKTPLKRRSAVEALGDQPSFEPTAEQLVFKGDSSNVDDVQAHEARVSTLRQSLAQQRQDWDAKVAAAKAEDEKSETANEFIKAQRALKSVQKRVANGKAAVQTASEALKSAEQAVKREKAKKLADEKKIKEKKIAEVRKAEEKKAREEARIAERERKKAEALESKRYPMDDLQLLEELQQRAIASGEAEPASDVPLPECAISREDSQATSGLLFVADFLSQFNKVLKVKSPAYESLMALMDATEGSTKEEQVQALAELYESLLETILKEAEEDSEEEVWLQFLNSASLSEVLRRFLSSQKATEPSLFKHELMTEALGTLETDGLEGLNGQQHQVLLTLLCDNILCSEVMRNALQERIDSEGDVKREMREAVAEKKGELKELLDAEKEARKREREEKRLAKKAKEEAAKLQKAQEQNELVPGSNTGLEADLATDGREPTPNAVSNPEQEQNGNLEEKRENVSDDEAEEAEPSFELPAELQDYLGDPSDRKGLLVWRQEQQAARKRLEKEKEKWYAAAKSRAKRKEEKLKAKLDEERVKEEAKAAAEDEVLRQQEAYEKELEKFSIRRQPLGMDRYYRRYWWGLAGLRAQIYVENAENGWAVLTEPSEIETLMDALDKRGNRELALYNSLEKVLPAVNQAMRKANVGQKIKARDDKETGRYSQRERTQAVFFSPSKQTQKKEDAANQELVETGIGNLTLTSLEAIVEALSKLQKEMSAWGVKAPEDGWKTWSLAFRNAKKDAKLAMKEEGSLGNVHGSLKTCLLEAEEMLYAIDDHEEPKDGLKEDSDKNSEDDTSQTDKSSASDATKLWHDVADREAWRHSVMEGKILASTAYAAALLQENGSELLDNLESPLAKRAAAAKQSNRGKKPSSAPHIRPKSAGTRRTREVEDLETKASKKTQVAHGKAGSKSAPAAKGEDRFVKSSKHDTQKGSKRKAATNSQSVWNVRVTRARAK